MHPDAEVVGEIGTLAHGEDNSPPRKWGYLSDRQKYLFIHISTVFIKTGWLSLTLLVCSGLEGTRPSGPLPCLPQQASARESPSAEGAVRVLDPRAQGIFAC